MVLQYRFSGPVHGVPEYLRNADELPPLPEYIQKTGPYFDAGAGSKHEIVTSYEFQKPQFPEALKKITGQLDAFRTIPGVFFSVHVLSSVRG